MSQLGEKPKGGVAVKQLFFTRKPDALYAITTGWLAPHVTIRNLNVPAESEVTLLGREGRLRHRMEGKDLVIDVPPLTPDQLPCQHAWTFKIPGAEWLPE